jgi:hypothetical protein
MNQLDTCLIHDDYEPDHPMPPHQTVKRSSSDSVTELPIIHEENLNQSQLFDMSIDMSVGMFHGEVATYITQCSACRRFYCVYIYILQIVVMVMESMDHKQVFSLLMVSV